MTVLRRLPFTLLLVALLVGVGVWSGTHVATASDDLVETVGFAPRSLLNADWLRLLTSPLVTVGGVTFYAALAMTLACVGSLEWRHGSRFAGVVFWGVHVATLLIESLVVVYALRLSGHPLGDLLHTAHDVGPSAGYYGCLGAVVGALGRSRWPLVGLVVPVLAVRLAVSWAAGGSNAGSLPADMAHLIAFPLGAIVGVFSHRPRRSTVQAECSGT